MKTGSISSFDEDHMEQWDETDSAMPKCYRRVEIQYSRFGVDDFDFGYESVDTLIFYNKTNYGGLETHIANSYCNALLQVLYFTLLLRYVTKSHIGQPCPKENCLCCELGFLFRMLEDSKGQNCQASNFLKAFSTIPQGAWTQSKVTKSDCVSFETKCEIAAYRLILLYRLFLLQLADGLGLFEPETPEPSLSYSGLIQNFNRFILEQLHQETNTPKTNPKMLRSIANEDDIAINEEDGEVPSLIQQLFGLKTASVSQCSQCGNEAMRMTYPFVVDLVYPKKSIPTVGQSKQFETVIPRKSFSDILHASLRRETPTKAFCTKCQQSQPMVARKILRGLPPVLTINSGVTSNEQAVFWRQYGEILEPNFTDGAGRVATESPWLPKRLGLKLNGNEFIVKELDREPLAQAEFEGDGIDCGVYELTSVVSQIQQEKDIPHLVSHVRVPDSELTSEKRSPWYLFNDFLVKNVTEQEVRSFKGSWKVPAAVQYTRVNANELIDLDSLPSSVDTSILFDDISISKNRTDTPVSHKILSPEELPGPGTLVAIDAEFVALNQEETEIRSDGTKSMIRPSRLSLARVSVLRGDDDAVPFIDDYIATSEPVVDYLTEFSGIEAGDLDPATSKHTLVPLKVAYKKLRLLVDMGCVFVGHGLKKDFRIINILVPPEQVIDTVDIYHIRNRQRWVLFKISLRFLAWHLLNEDIQKDTHDSVEDARTALAIYKKYLQYREEGRFGQVLEEVYEAGRKANWLKSAKDASGVVRAGTPTLTKTPALGIGDSTPESPAMV
ncbi:ubiquitin carboxyl-terminal hydrolase-domain-containing protein [Jimgerdemannia flammicorona]|uniref:Ubiquitin carboxyl-terminal hydrolase-domain-containing protein n=1 Tax=Jimgerdemannia flammicorona TaxID=994334 RepID=A0A433QPB9_9FUNG|nr:ubiquitin carboxyl-terminal hydrolase-domain-containing protein [Jimgerdemannia flammicorona]